MAENPACPARWKAPTKVVLALAGVPYKVLERNDDRKRWILENQGPGTVYWSTTQSEGLNGFSVSAGGFVIDEPPFIHVHEIWVTAATANTVIIVSEEA